MTATGTRLEARKNLVGKFNKGALMVFCYSIVEWLLELIGSGLKDNNALYLAYQIIFLIISVPISYGFLISFVKLKRDESVNAFSFLQIGFSNFSRAWSVAWNKFLKMIVPIILMILSIIIIAITISFTTADRILSNASSAKMITEKSNALEKAQIDLLAAKNNYSSNPTDSNQKAVQDAEKMVENAKKETDSVKPSSQKNHSELTVALAVLLVIIYIACMLYVFVKSLSLSLASFIAYDNDNMSGKESCELSQKLMKGNKGNLFVLSLSFIGWAILALLTLGIGFFWLTVYINVSFVCFYETLANKNTEINNENNENKEEVV